MASIINRTVDNNAANGNHDRRNQQREGTHSYTHVHTHTHTHTQKNRKSVRTARSVLLGFQALSAVARFDQIESAEPGPSTNWTTVASNV